MPEAKCYGLTIPQCFDDGVRIMSLAHRHPVLEVGDKVVYVNGSSTEGLNVHGVASLVRKRTKEQLLTLVVEKPKKVS